MLTIVESSGDRRKVSNNSSKHSLQELPCRLVRMADSRMKEGSVVACKVTGIQHLRLEQPKKSLSDQMLSEMHTHVMHPPVISNRGWHQLQSLVFVSSSWHHEEGCRVLQVLEPVTEQHISLALMRMSTVSMLSNPADNGDLACSLHSASSAQSS